MFASKDVSRKQSLGGTALQNSRDMQMTRYRRCRDTIGSEYTQFLLYRGTTVYFYKNSVEYVFCT